jgi:hypothetical protein
MDGAPAKAMIVTKAQFFFVIRLFIVHIGVILGRRSPIHKQLCEEIVTKKSWIAARFLLTLLWAFFLWRGPPGAGRRSTALEGDVSIDQ